MTDTRRPPLWWELPVALVGFLVCAGLPRVSFGADKLARAQVNAQHVLAVEEGLRLDVETSTNDWLVGRGWVTTIAGYHYATVYIVTSVAMLVFLYLSRPRLYRWARRSTLVLNLLAAVCFALFPVAPPRLNPDLTIVDTVLSQHIWGTWGSPVGDAVNQLAALPSLHFAWVLWVLVMLIIATRSVVLITLASIDVALTAVVVVATGNHYPLDLVAGAVLVAVSVPVTRPWSPERRGRTIARLGRYGDVLRRKAVLTDD
jgi:hypothetical protein